VFAVQVEHHRPLVLSALVDTATGAVLPWPVSGSRPVYSHRDLVARSRLVLSRLAHRTNALPQTEAAGLPGLPGLPGVPGLSGLPGGQGPGPAAGLPLSSGFLDTR
jgi:hypothetical protein